MFYSPRLVQFVRGQPALVRHTAAFLISIAVTGGFIYSDTRNEIQINNEKMGAIVDGIADSIDRQLSSWRMSLTVMSVSSDLIPPYDLQKFSNEVKRFAELTGTNMAFFRIDQDELSLVVHSQVPIEKLPQKYDFESINTFYQTMRSVEETGLDSVTDFFLGPIAGEYIAAVIVSKKHEIRSREMLSLNFSSILLSQFLQRIKLPEGYITAIVDSSGMIGARSQDRSRFIGKKIPSKTLEAYRLSESGFIETQGIIGAAHERYFAAFRRLKEAKGWTVSLLVPPTAYPAVGLRSSTLFFGFLSLIITNLFAWILGSAERQNIHTNEAFLRSTGRLLNEHPGAIFRAKLAKDGQVIIVSALGLLADTLLRDGEFVFSEELLFKIGLQPSEAAGGHEFEATQDARIFRILLSSSYENLLLNEEFNIYVFDITNLRAAETAAINSARLAALGQMAATLAHEMSQPLNVICMSADNAEYLIDKSDSANAKNKLRKIKDFALKGRRLIDNLLIYARGDREGSKPVAVDLRSAIEFAQDLTQPLWQKENIHFLVTFSSEDLHVMARPVELENIFVNLIVNSIDAFKVQGVASERNILIAVRSEDDVVVIRFKDNAGGVSDDVIEHIFEPFVTTKPVGHGTGLGLSFVLGVVRNWGGAISVQNRDAGAEFVLRLSASASVSSIT